MEMQQVRYFVALCETLNFSRAAETCNMLEVSRSLCYAVTFSI